LVTWRFETSNSPVAGTAFGALCGGGVAVVAVAPAVSAGLPGSDERKTRNARTRSATLIATSAIEIAPHFVLGAGAGWTAPAGVTTAAIC